MNAENNVNDRTVHKITLCARESMEIRGVIDVIRFDEQSVCLSTVCGTMEIEGNELHIHVLSMEQGIVTLDGKIDAVSYYDSAEPEKKGFLGKLFR